jgi:hypothetical protein
MHVIVFIVKVPGGIFKEHSRNIQGTFKEHSRNTQGIRNNSRNIQRPFKGADITPHESFSTTY